MSPQQQATKSEPVAVTEKGTPVFRAVNFELYTKPVGGMKILAYAGTAAFAGIIGYMTYQKHQQERSVSQPASV